MTTILCLICLLGFEMLYHTSTKAQFARDSMLQQWSERSPSGLKYTALLLLLLSLIGFILGFGLGSGFFYFLSVLMLVGGFVFILSPIGYFGARGIVVIAFVFFIFELI